MSVSPHERARRMEAADDVAILEIGATLRRPLTDDERLMLRVAFIKGENHALAETDEAMHDALAEIKR